jgi:hypothetical protein
MHIPLMAGSSVPLTLLVSEAAGNQAELKLNRRYPITR